MRGPKRFASSTRIEPSDSLSPNQPQFSSNLAQPSKSHRQRLPDRSRAPVRLHNRLGERNCQERSDQREFEDVQGQLLRLRDELERRRPEVGVDAREESRVC